MTRFIENCRCYHLISRLAHRAFFLDDDEKTRAVELLRRVEEFSIHFNRHYLSPLLDKDATQDENKDSGSEWKAGCGKSARPV